MNKYDSELFGDGRFPPPPLAPAAPPAAESIVPGAGGKAQPASRRALDESTKRLLASAVSRGYTRREAAAFVGCHLRTIQRERQRDSEFHAALVKAEQLAGCEAKDVVVQAARNNWRRRLPLEARAGARGSRREGAEASRPQEKPAEPAVESAVAPTVRAHPVFSEWRLAIPRTFRRNRRRRSGLRRIERDDESANCRLARDRCRDESANKGRLPPSSPLAMQDAPRSKTPASGALTQSLEG